MPRPPADKPGLPFSFWLMIAFGMVCILSGAVVGLFGPRLFPAHPPAHPAPVSGEPLPRPLGKPPQPG